MRLKDKDLGLGIRDYGVRYKWKVGIGIEVQGLRNNLEEGCRENYKGIN